MDWTTLTTLVEHLAWPVTVVVSLLVFKRNIAGTFNRLGSFSAGAQGVSINFLDEKIAAAKGVMRGIQPNVQEKSTTIQPQGPFSKLKKMEHSLHQRLIDAATANQLEFSQQTNLGLAEKLKEVGIISFQDYKLIEAFMEIEKVADGSLTDSQLNEIREIYEAINI